MQSLNGRERHEVFDAEGYYPTGDLFRLDGECYLKFEARRGERIKIHGANVAPLEVELAMTGLLGIEKAGVVGVARNDDTLLAAAVLIAPGRALDTAAVMADIRRRLSPCTVPRSRERPAEPSVTAT